MSLDPDKFTNMTNEMLRAAQDMAREASHAELAPLHVAASMFEQEGGVLALSLTQ